MLSELAFESGFFAGRALTVLLLDVFGAAGPDRTDDQRVSAFRSRGYNSFSLSLWLTVESAALPLSSRPSLGAHERRLVYRRRD